MIDKTLAHMIDEFLRPFLILCLLSHENA
jgi:hypothetical protein